MLVQAGLSPAPLALLFLSLQPLNSFARTSPLLLLFAGGRDDPERLATTACSSTLVLLLLLLTPTVTGSLLLDGIVTTARRNWLLDRWLNDSTLVCDASSRHLHTRLSRVLCECVLDLHDAIIKLCSIELLDGSGGGLCFHVD